MLYHSAVSTYYKAVRVGGEGDSRGNVLREMTSRDRSELPKSFVPREREFRLLQGHATGPYKIKHAEAG